MYSAERNFSVDLNRMFLEIAVKLEYVLRRSAMGPMHVDCLYECKDKISALIQTIS